MKERDVLSWTSLINSGCSLLSYVKRYTLPRLSDLERARLRNLYSEVAVVLTG